VVMVVTVVKLVLAPVMVIRFDHLALLREFPPAGEPLLDNQLLERGQPVLVVTNGVSILRTYGTS
jgi:hypothetical protein